MDGKLIHASGCVQHLFPSDGGRITVETVTFVEGKEINDSLIISLSSTDLCVYLGK